MLDTVSGGALQRVSQLMAEARDLLDRASNSKKKLEGEGEHTVGYISCHHLIHLPESPWARPSGCPEGDTGHCDRVTRPADLEQRFGANERAMAAKVTRLQALEQKVTGLLQEIQERANAYATC